MYDFNETDGYTALLVAVMLTREQFTAQQATASGLPALASAYVPHVIPSPTTAVFNLSSQTFNAIISERDLDDVKC